MIPLFINSRVNLPNWNGFGAGSNKYGSFWYGNSTDFPGFKYKKTGGAGNAKSRKMIPGGGIQCNQPSNLFNKFKPGTGGVGASSTSNRRAKNRIATVCQTPCGQFYNYLGRYDNYTSNPNGYFPYPVYPGPQTFVSPASNYPR